MYILTGFLRARYRFYFLSILKGVSPFPVPLPICVMTKPGTVPILLCSHILYGTGTVPHFACSLKRRTQSRCYSSNQKSKEAQTAQIYPPLGDLQCPAALTPLRHNAASPSTLSTYMSTPKTRGGRTLGPYWRTWGVVEWANTSDLGGNQVRSLV